MKCQKCGKNNANVRYTEIINGVKKEYILCEECAEKYGFNQKMNFDIPMNFGSLFGEFFDEYNSRPNLLNSFSDVREIKCKKCGTTYNDFIESGKFGCENCYSVFSNRLDGVLKKIQGDNVHKGRKGKDSNLKIDYKAKQKVDNVNSKKTKLEELKQKLDDAIKEERYEDAADLRDEIKKLEK